MKACTFLSGLLLMTMHTSHLFAEDDTRLHELVPADAKVERLAGGMKFTEGPVWISDPAAPGGGFVVLSDQPNDALMRWNEKDGLTEHRKPADHPNGHTL